MKYSIYFIYIGIIYLDCFYGHVWIDPSKAVTGVSVLWIEIKNSIDNFTHKKKNIL